MADTLLRADIPDPKDLCCVVVNIDSTEVKDSSAKSHFQWKIMKCRLIIYTMQDAVIACPFKVAQSSIYVITSVEFFRSEIFQNNLREMNVKWLAPGPVTPDVYANCLRYSLEFCIAPRWNKVSDYLLTGKDFLTSSQDNLGMKFSLSVETRFDRNIQVIAKVHPLQVKMFHLTLNDFLIPSNIIGNFMADPAGVIDVASFGIFRATVLPSLKTGRVMKALKNIPATSSFQNYEELRRHWKNMYGYHLPKSDRGITYYNIKFPVPNAENFLYPDICVRSRLSETPNRGNRQVIIRTFLRDVNEMMPMVCEKKFIITTSQENSSSTNLSPRSNGQETPRTPEIVLSRIHEFLENIDDTTHLSFSRFNSRNELRRDRSALMSPTPSLRGNSVRRDEPRTKKIRSILTDNQNSRDIKTVFSHNNDQSEMKSRIPNDGNSSQEEKFKSKNPLENSQMKMDFTDVLDSTSSFDDSQVVSGYFTTKKSLSCSSETAMKKIPKIIGDETAKCIFPPINRGKVTSGEGRSPIQKKMTLYQKLMRPMSSMKNRPDAHSTETSCDPQTRESRFDDLDPQSSIDKFLPYGSGDVRNPKNL